MHESSLLAGRCAPHCSAIIKQACEHVAGAIVPVIATATYSHSISVNFQALSAVCVMFTSHFIHNLTCMLQPLPCRVLPSQALHRVPNQCSAGQPGRPACRAHPSHRNTCNMPYPIRPHPCLCVSVTGPTSKGAALLWESILMSWMGQTAVCLTDLPCIAQSSSWFALL
jgi:hypothetical protein